MERTTYGGGSGMSAYVGYSTEPVDVDTLNRLIDSCTGEGGLLFLRWPHRVKMLPVRERPKVDLTCQEGQAFNHSKELRWKPKGEGYEVLLLSEDDSESVKEKSLSPLGKAWKTELLDAKVYPKTETRLPRKIIVPDDADISQRYFINAETGCVQFVALSVARGGKKDGSQ